MLPTFFRVTMNQINCRVSRSSISLYSVSCSILMHVVVGPVQPVCSNEIDVVDAYALCDIGCISEPARGHFRSNPCPTLRPIDCFPFLLRVFKLLLARGNFNEEEAKPKKQGYRTLPYQTGSHTNTPPNPLLVRLLIEC